MRRKLPIDQGENSLDFGDRHAYQVVDTDSVKNREVREVGCEWLCMQALQQLGRKQ